MYCLSEIGGKKYSAILPCTLPCKFYIDAHFILWKLRKVTFLKYLKHQTLAIKLNHYQKTSKLQLTIVGPTVICCIKRVDYS